MNNDIYGGGELLATTRTRGQGADGSLPLTEDMLLLNEASGNLFGMTQNVAMGMHPEEVNREQYVIVSTKGGLRGAKGEPIALGYHTGHWEIEQLVQEAALTIRGGRRHSLRHLFLRPLRWTLARHNRHDGQPGLPQTTRPL